MHRPLKRARTAIAALSLITISAIIAACGGGGSGGGGSVADVASTGVTPQVLSGVAATGAPMIGQVSVKDSSSAPKEKTTVTGSDGSFSFDVSDMKAPFMLKATSAVGGTTMYSFADQPGTANIHPLSSVAVARAAEVDDPEDAYQNSDSARHEKIRSGMPAAMAALKTQLKPLLDAFDVDLDDLIKDDFAADQTGLDAVLDNVKVAISGGTLTITNATTGAVLFTASVKDIEHGKFTDDENDMPKRGPRPAAPTGVSATGGDGQVTIDWQPVSDAISYTIYWSTKNIAASDEGAKKIRHVKNPPYVQTGLAAGTTYYYTVRAVNRAGRSRHSAEASATTNGTATTTAATTTTTAASTTTTAGPTTTTAATTTTTAAPTTTTAAPTTTTAAPTTTTAAPTTTTAAPTTTTAAPTTTTAAPTTTTAAPTTTTAAPTTTTAAPTTTTAAPTTTTAAPTTTTAAPTTTTTTTTATTTTTTLAINGAALYGTNCAGCHNPLATTEKRGATAAEISAGIAGVSSMRNSILATNGGIPLTQAQIAAIAAAMQ
ncbi:MAG: fibronectin type III domain-containing protein [Betaproteobacteria bacterium]|nr:fibronectin type III domain-containing protein [Betaproteobacteria bacterium]